MQAEVWGSGALPWRAASRVPARGCPLRLRPGSDSGFPALSPLSCWWSVSSPLESWEEKCSDAVSHGSASSRWQRGAEGEAKGRSEVTYICLWKGGLAPGLGSSQACTMRPSCLRRLSQSPGS